MLIELPSLKVIVTLSNTDEAPLVPCGLANTYFCCDTTTEALGVSLRNKSSVSINCVAVKTSFELFPAPVEMTRFCAPAEAVCDDAAPVCVIVGWIVVWTTLGAWRMVTRDS